MRVVLVIEEPNECIDCPCYRQTKEDGELYEDCKAMMMPLNWREVTEKPSWCPLKPLPKKRPVHYNDEIFGEVENLTNIGWNKCVEEIENESRISN